MKEGKQSSEEKIVNKEVQHSTQIVYSSVVLVHENRVQIDSMKERTPFTVQKVGLLLAVNTHTN